MKLKVTVLKYNYDVVLLFLFVVGDIESMLPLVLSVILSEVLVDCVKHAFITKFNDISPDIYMRYRLTLAKDLTDSRSTKVIL